MSWNFKEHESRFDVTPIAGLFFLDGNIIERTHPNHYTWGMKSPMIEFPSGEVHPVWDERDPQVEVMSTVDLPLFATRDHAYERVAGLMRVGLVNVNLLEKVGESQLRLWAEPTHEHCLVTYDNEQQQLVDVEVTIISPPSGSD